MSAQSINIEIVIPSLPEGWTGTPDEYGQWLSDNITFLATGSFLTGQIGGDRPGSDTGLFINGRALEVWNADRAKYVPVSNVPIGAAIPYFGTTATVPDDYQLCDASELVKEAYPELWAILTPSDGERRRAGDSALSFRVPDLRGRVPMGAGVGVYYDGSNNPTGAGIMAERTLGDVVGSESILRKAKHSGAPSTWQDFTTRTAASQFTTSNIPSSNANWIIRKQ